MPVFISHRQGDTDKALRLQQFLEINKVRTVLDVLDDLIASAANESPARLTEAIVQRLGSCTHLMIVFTRNTQGSFWVPFEIAWRRSVKCELRFGFIATPSCRISSRFG
jgi:hypothetical protein